MLCIAAPGSKSRLRRNDPQRPASERPDFTQSRITTSRSVPDSPPHASPGRPSIWRTLAPRLSLGKVVKVSVLGSKRWMALAAQSVAHTRSLSSTKIEYVPHLLCGIRYVVQVLVA